MNTMHVSFPIKSHKPGSVYKEEKRNQCLGRTYKDEINKTNSLADSW